MGGSNGLTAGSHHLVEGAAGGELWVVIPAEFTRPTGTCVEAIHHDWVDVFHEERLLEGETNRPALRRSTTSASDEFSDCLTDAFVLQGAGLVQAPRGNPKSTGVWKDEVCRNESCGGDAL